MRPRARENPIPYVSLVLTVLGVLALASLRWVRLSRCIAICLGSWILAAAIFAGDQGWPTTLGSTLIGHLGAGVALVAALLAVILRPSEAPPPKPTPQGEWARAFGRLAMGYGVMAAVVLAFEMTVVLLLRAELVAPTHRFFHTSAAGLLDIGVIFLAVLVHPASRRMVTLVFWVLVLAIGWSGLMIPTGLGLAGEETSWPGWMPWTLWCFVWGSLLVGGFTIAQGYLYYRRRVLAWPDRLEWLLEAYPPWPGFRPSAAAAMMALLPVGVYHASWFLVPPCAVLLGVSGLMLAHREWNDNFVDIGLAYVTLAVTSFVVACVPDWVGGPTLTTRMPLLFAAAMIGLGTMVFFWQWLPNVWDQQLHEGRPWTTTGWMMPVTRRFGLIVGSFAVLVSMQLALWPELAPMRDDTWPRWTLGLFAHGWLLGMLVLATLLSKRQAFAALTLLHVLLMGAFVIVRFPDNSLKFWALERWPAILAALAPASLGLSRLADRRPWLPFRDLLDASAMVVMPAAAVAGTIVISAEPVATLLGKLILYDVPRVRLATWLILAASFYAHSRLPHRRGLRIASAVLVVAAIVNLFL